MNKTKTQEKYNSFKTIGSYKNVREVIQKALKEQEEELSQRCLKAKQEIILSMQEELQSQRQEFEEVLIRIKESICLIEENCDNCAMCNTVNECYKEALNSQDTQKSGVSSKEQNQSPQMKLPELSLSNRERESNEDKTPSSKREATTKRANSSVVLKDLAISQEDRGSNSYKCNCTLGEIKDVKRQLLCSKCCVKEKEKVEE